MSDDEVAVEKMCEFERYLELQVDLDDLAVQEGEHPGGVRVSHYLLQFPPNPTNVFLSLTCAVVAILATAQSSVLQFSCVRSLEMSVAHKHKEPDVFAGAV